MYFKTLFLTGFLLWITTDGQVQNHQTNSRCNTSLNICSYINAAALKLEVLPTVFPPTTKPGIQLNGIYSGQDVYERSWTKILPIFFIILFGTIFIHCCHRCHKRSRASRISPPAIPSAPTAPISPRLSPPLVVTFASIHSNPFEQHMTPHTASLLVRPSISEADPRARPPIGPLLQFNRVPFDRNPVPSAPSAELVVTPQNGRPPITAGLPDLPPPYHLALQLEEPPPPYSEIRTH